MATRDFLVEIGTEELPPKALSRLSSSFETGFSNALAQHHLTFSAIRRYATPRRLALIVSDLIEKQADTQLVKFGPAVSAAFDAKGNPTPAALGFAKSCGVEVSALATAKRDGVEKMSFSTTEDGKTAQSLLPDIVNDVLAQLPIPKRMRWGSSRDEFVRPVHWIVLLFGGEGLSATLLGVHASTFTFGHRFT